MKLGYGSKLIIFVVLLALAGLVLSVAQAQAENASLAFLTGASQSREQQHIVQKGQLAVGIAQDYGLSLDELRRLNPGRELARLQIGDKLVVGTIQEEAPAPPEDRPDKIAMLAASEDRLDQPQKKEDPGLVLGALSMIFKLAIVLGLAYLTILLLKWFTGKREVMPRSQRELRVGDTVRLSSTSSLHLVSVKGKTLLVGCSSGQVNLLQEFEDEQQEEDSSESPNGRFAEYLAKYSEASARTGAAGRVAGLLRDCAAQLRKRQAAVQTSARRNTRVKGRNGK